MESVIPSVIKFFENEKHYRQNPCKGDIKADLNRLRKISRFHFVFAVVQDSGKKQSVGSNPRRGMSVIENAPAGIVDFAQD
jgi:hypothetical protein